MSRRICGEIVGLSGTTLAGAVGEDEEIRVRNYLIQLPFSSEGLTEALEPMNRAV